MINPCSSEMWDLWRETAGKWVVHMRQHWDKGIGSTRALGREFGPGPGSQLKRILERVTSMLLSRAHILVF